MSSEFSMVGSQHPQGFHETPVIRLQGVGKRQSNLSSKVYINSLLCRHMIAASEEPHKYPTQSWSAAGLKFP
jgi:hypothetical protein